LEQRTSFYNNATAHRSRPTNGGAVFCFLWLLLFVLYYPAAKAGFVTDFTGWLDQIRNHSFWDYINRTNFHAQSLYQFTQFNTYIFYKLFGVNPWLWHLLFITLHTINTCLLLGLVAGLLEDVQAEGSRAIVFGGALLFTVSPYISEVIVWEPSFHFLQGLLLILLILRCTQKYIRSGHRKYAWRAGILYLLSLFSLEVFYITPFLVLTLGVYYRFNPSFDKKILGRVMLYFFAPMLLLLAVRIVGYKLMAGDWVSRIGSVTVTVVNLESFGKPAKYLFHLLLLGRFFAADTRHAVYAFCDSAIGIALFYGAVIIVFSVLAYRYRVMSGRAKVAGLLFAWVLIALMLLVPLWFGDMLLVLFDRYTYFAGAFFYTLVSILVSFISVQYIRMGIIAIYALVNLRFAIQVSRYWGKSYRVDEGLLHNVPDPGDKTVILLNLPESMHGIPMIGSGKESEFRFMHNLLLRDKRINNAVYDGLSYNMAAPTDGAHATVMNDSMVRVTLNQWGTWWWYEGKGGYGYENSDYKLHLNDPGHFYELTLKRPAQQYQLLYQVGDHWNVVDWSKRGVDQN